MNTGGCRTSATRRCCSTCRYASWVVLMARGVPQVGTANAMVLSRMVLTRGVAGALPSGATRLGPLVPERPGWTGATPSRNANHGQVAAASPWRLVKACWCAGALIRTHVGLVHEGAASELPVTHMPSTAASWRGTASCSPTRSGGERVRPRAAETAAAQSSRAPPVHVGSSARRRRGRQAQRAGKARAVPVLHQARRGEGVPRLRAEALRCGPRRGARGR